MIWTVQNILKIVVSEWWISYPTPNELTHWGLDKMAAISQMIFWNAFSQMKTFEFQIYFIEIFSSESNWPYVIIDLDNGLAPNRRRAII